MAKIALNKSALQKAREDLKLYQRLLPSLDLKRMQLTAELKRAQEQLENAKAEVESLKARAAEQLPMLANEEIDVSGLVQVDSVQVGDENLVGVKLPVLEEIQCTVREYSMLAKPHWVDDLVDLLKQMAESQARVKVAAERVRRLEQAAGDMRVRSGRDRPDHTLSWRDHLSSRVLCRCHVDQPPAAHRAPSCRVNRNMLAHRADR